MMPDGPRVPVDFVRDTTRVAKITGVDELAIEGFIVAVWTHDGSVRLAHNGCCTAHAAGALRFILGHGDAPMVPCSGDQ